MARQLITLAIFLLAPAYGWSSSCCGQAPTSFTVLSLHQKLSLTTGYTLSDSVGRVYQDPNEFFVFENKKRTVQTLSINMASQITDRSQAFIAFGQSYGAYESAGTKTTAEHLTDTLVGYNYEILPEYSFSYWKPNVYLSALVNLPTGRSIYDNNSLGEAAGVTGHNQYGIGLGITLKKVYYPLTLSFQAKTIELIGTSINSTQVSGFYDSSLSLIGSFAFQNFTTSLGLSYNDLSTRTVNTINSAGANNTTVLFSVQTPLKDSVFLGLSYSDQTLLGRSKNTLLNRNYSLNLNYNYF